jgi:hypothetical protein
LKRGRLRLKGLIFFFSFLLLPLFCSYGAQHIVLYHVGERDPAPMTLLKRHLAGKGFAVSVFEGTTDIDKQAELAGKINRIRASLFLAVDFGFGEKEQVLIAVTDVKRKSGQVLAIEDVPGAHASSSREFADLVAAAFGGKVLELPLFPLLGIDTPGLFMEIECPKEQANEVLGKITDSMQKYLGKGMKK